MDFELQAQYESYTRAELMQILDHKDGYTPEAVNTASAIMDQRYPGWDAVPEHEVQLAQEERYAAATHDLLGDLEDPLMPQDHLSKAAFWIVFSYLVLCTSMVVYYTFNMLAIGGGVPVMEWGVFSSAVFCTLTVLWFRKTRWGWNLVYACLLYDFVWYTRYMVKTPVVFPSISYIFPFIITLLIYFRILVILASLWLAARRRTADMFGVVLPNWVFTVVVGWLLALGYLCLTLGE